MIRSAGWGLSLLCASITSAMFVDPHKLTNSSGCWRKKNFFLLFKWVWKRKGGIGTLKFEQRDAEPKHLGHISALMRRMSTLAQFMPITNVNDHHLIAIDLLWIFFPPSPPLLSQILFSFPVLKKRWLWNLWMKWGTCACKLRESRQRACLRAWGGQGGTWFCCHC